MLPYWRFVRSGVGLDWIGFKGYCGTGLKRNRLHPFYAREEESLAPLVVQGCSLYLTISSLACD